MLRVLRRGVDMARMVILGAGLVGAFVAQHLSEHDVLVIDSSADALARIDCTTMQGDALSEEVLEMQGIDVWINMLPGGIAHAVRKPLLSRGQTVVDLAFTLEDPRSIKGGRMVYDVGIAPGLSNLWSAAIEELDSLEIMVGGIPTEPDDGWSYMAPFSPADVIEEYTRPARIKLNGELVELPALERRQLVDYPSIGTLEAGLTDGLRSLLDTISANTMLEYTLRWPGHYDKWFQRTSYDGLLEEWEFDEQRPEMTVLSIDAKLTDGNDWHGMLIDRGKDGWSSMARTTGLVTLAAVDAALLGLIPEGVHPPEGIPELLELAETRLLQAGVHIERDSFKERPIA